MVNGWKIAFWILLIVWIIETSLFGYIVYVGTEIVRDEADCQINVCGNYDAFYFDYMEDICYCYKDNEIVYEEFLG